MSQNFGSLFSNNQNTQKTTEDVIESKMTGRVETLRTETTYEDYREDTTEKEIRLRKDEREKRFRDKRLKQPIKIEMGQSLKDQMTVSQQIYDECSKMKVTVKFSIYFRLMNYLHTSINSNHKIFKPNTSV